MAETQKKSFWRRIYPFNAEQTVTLLSEFGPLITLFVVNALVNVHAGIWALIVATILSMIVMRIVLNRLPMFAMIAGGITLIFSGVALYYDDPMWVQLKVTLFNVVFALFLWTGLLLNKNFFKYTFEKSFHYSAEGWRKFTRSFIALFLFLAAVNEGLRLGFPHNHTYTFFGYTTDGLNIWVMAKVLFVMPFSGLFAFWMTRQLQKYAITPEQAAEEARAAAGVGVAIASNAAGITQQIPER